MCHAVDDAAFNDAARLRDDQRSKRNQQRDFKQKSAS